MKKSKQRPSMALIIFSAISSVFGLVFFGLLKKRNETKTIKDYWHERDKNLDLRNKIIDDKYSNDSTESLLRPEKGEYIKPKS